MKMCNEDDSTLHTNAGAIAKRAEGAPLRGVEDDGRAGQDTVTFAVADEDDKDK